MVFRLTVIRNSYFPAFNARCVGGSDRIPELRNRHTIPSTPQLPLRGAQQLAQMYIDEGHTLTWPTSSECDGINSQTMKMIFDANSEFLLTEYVHGWNIHCISPC